MSNVVRFPSPAVRALPDNSLRGDCERLMRRLVKDGRTPEEEMRLSNKDIAQHWADKHNADEPMEADRG